MPKINHFMLLRSRVNSLYLKLEEVEKSIAISIFVCNCIINKDLREGLRIFLLTHLNARLINDEYRFLEDCYFQKNLNINRSDFTLESVEFIYDILYSPDIFLLILSVINNLREELQELLVQILYLEIQILKLNEYKFDNSLKKCERKNFLKKGKMKISSVEKFDNTLCE